MENNQQPIRKTPSVQPVSDNRNAKTKGARRKASASTVAIFTLSLLLVFSIALGITLAFFASDATAAGNITLGDPVTIGVTQGGTSVTALTFDGTALPGTDYDQTIAFAAPANTSEAVLRAKLTIQLTAEDSEDITVTTADDWTLGEDGYYYYAGTVTAGNSVDFCTKLTVPTTLTNTSANNIYTITAQVEAIQFANGAAAEVWTTAPATWTTNWGSGTRPE